MAAEATVPLVSIVMPVRNGESYLAESIDSIRAQDFTDWELVVVDDNSTDGTAAILARNSRADARIRPLPAVGKGIVDALNQAMAASRGALVARMDADDIAAPNRLTRQVREMTARPGLALLGSAAVEIDRRGVSGRLVEMPDGDQALRSRLRVDNPFLHPTVMMRRTAITEAGGYRPAFTLAEDYDLWIRLSELGEIANLHEPLMRLRRHDGQVSRTRRLEQRAASALVRQAAYGPAAPGFDPDSHPDPISAAAAWLGKVDRHGVDKACARDAAIMLRACTAQGALSSEVQHAARAALRPLLSTAEKLALELKLAMRR